MKLLLPQSPSGRRRPSSCMRCSGVTAPLFLLPLSEREARVQSPPQRNEMISANRCRLISEEEMWPLRPRGSRQADPECPPLCSRRAPARDPLAGRTTCNRTLESVTEQPSEAPALPLCPPASCLSSLSLRSPGARQTNVDLPVPLPQDGCKDPPRQGCGR